MKKKSKKPHDRELEEGWRDLEKKDQFAMGTKVKVVSDKGADYGRLLGRTGKIVAGGCLFQGKRRYNVDFGNDVVIHVFSMDLSDEG